MADLRLPSVNAPAPAAPVPRPVGAQSAQRSFFDAALGRAQAASTPPPPLAPVGGAAATAAGGGASNPAPAGYRRPGSLLDIKV